MRYCVVCSSPHCQFQLNFYFESEITFCKPKTAVQHTCSMDDHHPNHITPASLVQKTWVQEWMKKEQRAAGTSGLKRECANHGILLPYNSLFRAVQLLRRQYFIADVKQYAYIESYAMKLNAKGQLSILEKQDNAFYRWCVVYREGIQGMAIYLNRGLQLDATFIKNGTGGKCCLLYPHDFEFNDELHFIGTLFVACYKNGNNNIRLLAVAVVPTENADNWTWFVGLIKSQLVDEPSYIISDRDKGLLLACKNVYPNVHHFYCYRHVMENFNSKFKKKELKVIAWRLAKAKTLSEFIEQEDKLRARNETAYNWLKEIGFEKISLLHSPVCRYGMVTSNNVESMNSRFADIRRLPIMELLLSIEKFVLVDMVEDRKTLATWNTTLTGFMAGEYAKSINEASEKSTVIQTGLQEYIVHVGHEQFQVSYGPQRFKCSCGLPALLRFPCTHYTAVLLQRRENVSGHCCPTWSKDLFSSACQPFDVEYPLTIVNELTRIETFPPSYLKKRGRPKKRRYESQGATIQIDREIAQSTRRPYKCRVCNIEGHNARTCTARDIQNASKLITKAIHNSRQHSNLKTLTNLSIKFQDFNFNLYTY